MKFLLIFFIFISSTSSFAQAPSSSHKGNYFTTTSHEYFEKVIKPWKYQFKKSNNTSDSVKKIGEIIFWRSEAIYDSASKQYWKPDISFDIYPASALAYAKSLSDKIKLSSACDTINMGGDILKLGNFILLSSSPCVNCASPSNFDYCRNIMKRILSSVRDKETKNWNKILKQLIIRKGNFDS